MLLSDGFAIPLLQLLSKEHLHIHSKFLGFRCIKCIKWGKCDICTPIKLCKLWIARLEWGIGDADSASSPSTGEDFKERQN